MSLKKNIVSIRYTVLVISAFVCKISYKSDEN